jgi:hypothetical protein
VKPVGLTRAEEEAEQPPEAPRAVAAVQPGRPRCQAAVPPTGDRCVAEARGHLVWPDGDRSLACADCARRLQQLGESHRSSVRFEPFSAAEGES